MTTALRLCVFALALLILSPAPSWAAQAPFDLAGPKLRIQVTRAGRSLPISQVPTLSAGDQVQIQADLPEAQSVHYLLVAAFLRGATNPPPEKWFFSSETWKRKQAEGLKLTVPEGAQQVVVFLAPETGGDFKAIVNAVTGRPGAFVRASQDLNQASLDRSRLDAFLAAIRKVDQADPERLKTTSPLLARSLTIKLEAGCLEKAPEARAPCLIQGHDSLVLDDGHSTSMVQALASGYSADLVQQLSATPKAGGGAYSPYVASILDIAHIMDGFRTAQYQYIPALVTQQQDELSLLLNAPPSFKNPKSVLLAALPPIEPPHPPPLRAVEPGAVSCLQRPGLVLPVEGAPLAFSGGYAHHMALRLKDKAGHAVELPAAADAAQGGFVVDASKLDAAAFDPTLEGTLHGFWGFEAYEGPVFRLQSGAAQTWRVAGDQPLVAGRESRVQLEAPAPACVESVTLRRPSGQTDRLDWQPDQAGRIAVALPLKDAQPGAFTLLVKSYGAKEPVSLPLQAFAQLGQFDGFAYSAGDAAGVLRGGDLDQVAGLNFGGVEFAPAGRTAANDLSLTAADPAAAGRLKAGDALTATIRLKDGRTVNLEARVGSPRPGAVLLAKNVRPQPAGEGAAIQLTDPDEVARGSILTFSIRAQAPASFSGKEVVEVATAGGAFATNLTTAGGLTLQDSQVAVATLDTGKAFNASASGPLQFRLVVDGMAGDWRPLATLVRLPALRELKCPAEADQPCQLSGANLFLVDALSGDPQFDKPMLTPPGFAGDMLPAPRPAAGKLYLKLHDAPAVVNSVSFPSSAGAGNTP